MRTNVEILPVSPLITLVATSFLVAAAAQTPAAPPALDQLRKGYGRAIDKVDTEYVAARRKGVQAYLNELAELEERFRKAGNLEGVLAVRREKERNDLPASGSDNGASGERLTRLRRNFARAAATLEQRRDADRLRWGRAYLERLAKLKAHLTREGLVDAALAVKDEEEKIGAVVAGLSRTAKAGEEKEARGPRRGKGWTSPATGMEFVWTEALNCWVGKYEVTNSEYRVKEQAHASKAYRGHNLDDGRRPVAYVTWRAAQAYPRWLTDREHKTGKLPNELQYRLPTGKEWMTFAQCDDGRKYPWGRRWPPKRGRAGNYRDDKTPLGGIGIEDYQDGHVASCPVEVSWENPWGLYGVGGNVWECTTKAPLGPFDAWRGGSWSSGDQEWLQCSARFTDSAPSQLYNTGLRLVLSP
ncbi:MAG: SUMF1/EgtB/PvdO family nonheme iron enzyme [Lentisphaerae bacterium]|jgi:formylglycine-generating enzyme required for sulfatase activity|nr:SUMF1/EgtB/PvdO family nonheme iron enzyme [Lentisphaerota bacterium]MBT5609684.1 SUMF1/EgtB/PvdO family nonheme iron enzyme [Lentisphaerota bacterium]MBT7054808.1 SUMF1/EgtB/PvdO family nonheme iron enzyme [Lentisphaerota bacterium]MBT7840917.1 SUMF1/EgtB/PvdO family nonheme iron enzyme [Lentisphaerota bacterium]